MGKIEDDKAKYTVIAENLQVLRNDTNDEFDKLKKELVTERDEIKDINDARAKARADMTMWRKQWKVRTGKDATNEDIRRNPSDESRTCEKLDRQMKEKVNIVNIASARVMDLRQEIEDLDFHLQIANDRKKRGVSKERRPFKKQYMIVDTKLEAHDTDSPATKDQQQKENGDATADGQSQKRLASAIRKKRVGSSNSNVSFAE
jgi:hypothetical protein